LRRRVAHRRPLPVFARPDRGARAAFGRREVPGHVELGGGLRRIANIGVERRNETVETPVGVEARTRPHDLGEWLRGFERSHRSVGNHRRGIDQELEVVVRFEPERTGAEHELAPAVGRGDANRADAKAARARRRSRCGGKRRLQEVRLAHRRGSRERRARRDGDGERDGDGGCAQHSGRARDTRRARAASCLCRASVRRARIASGDRNRHG